MRLHLSNFHISFLRDAARLVDSRIREVEIEAKSAESSEAESICETGEYMYGYGLVACQQFISYCIAESSLDSKKALNLGPHHECGASMVSLVNALANRWKHQAGWGKRTTPQESRTISTLSHFGLGGEDPYFTANALAIMLRPHRPRIQRVIPFLRQWNNALRSVT
jgi:hypothetical protein